MSGGRPRRVRIIAGLALLASIAIAVVVHRNTELELDPRALREQIEALGWVAPLAFVVIAALRPVLLLPSWVVMSAGGMLFGWFGGVVFGTLGVTAGAALVFGIARGLGRHAVERRLSGSVARIDAYLRRRGPLWTGLWTAIPITPLTPVHVTAGLSGMPALPFVFGVGIGLVPRTALFSFFGDSLAEGDLTRISIAIGVLVVAVVIGIWIARRMAGDARADAGAAPGSEASKG